MLRVDEIDKLVACATPAYKNIVALAAYGGLRASEIAGLIWDDVSFVDGCIHIRSQLAPLKKGEPPRRVKLKSRASTRTVVLLDRATEALLDQLRREQEKGFGHAEDFVFTTGAGTGRPYCRNRISSKGIGQAARKAGLGKVRCSGATPISGDAEGVRRCSEACRGEGDGPHAVSVRAVVREGLRGRPGHGRDANSARVHRVRRAIS